MLDARRASRSLLVVCALLVPACDLVVGNGEEIRAANGGFIFGSGGTLDTPARPAVTLLPGGTAVIEDASVVGGALTIASGDPVAGSSAPGIRVQGGRLVLQQGTIRGGALVFQGPDLGRASGTQGSAGSGIAGRNVRLEISAGLVVGGDVTLMMEPGGQAFSFGGALTAAGPAVALRDSEILISGGTFQLGVKWVLTAFTPRPLFEVDTSTVAIRGGEFRGGGVDLGASQSLIAGGRFEVGIATGFTRRFVDDDTVPPPGCTEIRAGTIPRIDIDVNETAFLFGSGFNLPLGEVIFPTDAEIGFPTHVRLGPFTAGRFVDLTGQYADGSPFSMVARVGQGSRLILAAPDQPGCPG